jgi:hypothetical protein
MPRLISINKYPDLKYEKAEEVEVGRPLELLKQVQG